MRELTQKKGKQKRVQVVTRSIWFFFYNIIGLNIFFFLRFEEETIKRQVQIQICANQVWNMRELTKQEKNKREFKYLPGASGSSSTIPSV
jgi:hypothetical protein